MSISTWLPPLDTNHDYSVHVTAKQNQPSSQTSSNSSLEFIINLYVTITFLCSDPKILSNTKLKGLSLSKTFHLPFDCLDTSKILPSRSIIAHMFSLVPVPFSLERSCWRAKRLNGFKSSNLLGNVDIASCLLKYLIDMRKYSSSNDQCLEVEVSIDKEVFVPRLEFEGWIFLYELHKDLSPRFEEEYQEAISRPLSEEVAFERWAGPLARSLMSWDKYVLSGRDSEGEVCSICLERLLVGSRVPQLHCGHKFHGKCITKWLNTSLSCPLCRNI